MTCGDNRISFGGRWAQRGHVRVVRGIAGRFGRVEPRRRAWAFLFGLLSDVDNRSCWQLAEQAGDTSPHAMQRLLGEASGTPTPCVMTCAAMWSTRSATPTG